MLRTNSTAVPVALRRPMSMDPGGRLLEEREENTRKDLPGSTAVIPTDTVPLPLLTAVPCCTPLTTAADRPALASDNTHKSSSLRVADMFRL